MKFETPLIRGRLIQRYKRFLADVELPDGTPVTASCPNTGSMLGLAQPNAAVWLSQNDSPTRKHRYTWHMVEADVGKGPTIVGIDSSLPNAIVAEALAAGALPELSGYASVRREVKYGVNSRVDFLLEAPGKPPCYLEVKNVHFMRKPGLAEFPDSKTERGARHLAELTEMVGQGHRAVMLFIVQRGDAHSLDLAADIDPEYARAFNRAWAAGVQMLAYRCNVKPTGIMIDRRIAIAGTE